MGNSNEKYKLIENITNTHNKTPDINLIQKFDCLYYSFTKKNNVNLDNNGTTIYKKKCQILFYPDFIKIKVDNNYLYRYTYYQIKSWKSSKKVFIMDTINNEELTFNEINGLDCSKQISNICQDIIYKKKINIIENNLEI